MATHLVFLPGESHGQRSLADYSPWGAKSQTQLKQLSARAHTHTHTHTHTTSTEEGIPNIFPYSTSLMFYSECYLCDIKSLGITAIRCWLLGWLCSHFDQPPFDFHFGNAVNTSDSPRLPPISNCALPQCLHFLPNLALMLRLLSCFQFLAIKNQSSINICVQVFVHFYPLCVVNCLVTQQFLIINCL